MSEEEKEVKEEAPKKQAAAENEAAEEQPKQPKVLKHDRVKVTRMTLNQVENALEELQKHMGGFHSRYAQSLLAQKAKLMGETPSVQQKAA